MQAAVIRERIRKRPKCRGGDENSALKMKVALIFFEGAATSDSITSLNIYFLRV